MGNTEYSHLTAGSPCSVDDCSGGFDGASAYQDQYLESGQIMSHVQEVMNHRGLGRCWSVSVYGLFSNPCLDISETILAGP
jgi:hypothetical protein